MAERVQSWRSVKPAPLVLLSGPEDVIARCAIAQLRARVRTTAPDAEISDLDAGSYAPGALLTVASPSLFAEPRLIVIDRGEAMTDAFLADGLAYARDAEPDAVVVLRHRKGVRGKKLLTAWRAAGCTTVKCDALKRADQRAQFVAELFTARGRDAERAAVQKLAEIFATGPEQLLGAVEQLLQDVEGTVAVGDVERYFGGRGETSGFAIADAALDGEEARAVVLLRQAFDDGLNPVPVLAAIVMKLRVVAAVHGLTGPPAALAGRVGAAPWQVRRAQVTARRWSEAALAAAVRQAAATDALIKGGAIDPDYQLERFVRALARRDRAVLISRR